MTAMVEMRRLLLVLCGLLMILCSVPGRAATAGDALAILCYHEIAEAGDALSPDFAVSPAGLAEQLDWLSRQGYHFVSMQQVLDARAGGKALPERPVLLTFDDGYRSVHEQAWPLLRARRIPAVVAVVTDWLESFWRVDMGDQRVSRDRFLSWRQLREMQASGLVEVASHSHDLHHGIVGNPQGSLQPAATTRAWLGAIGYEPEARYRERVRADLARSSRIIARRLGQAPRVMVWPYGGYNESAASSAEALGMAVGMTLDDGPNQPDLPLRQLRRILMSRDMGVAELSAELALRRDALDDNDRAARIMHVDLDNIHDPDPAQQQRNLGLLLDRIQAMQVNTVYLQAYSDPDGNGSADALYFRNRHLPVKADLFNQVAWQILKRTRARRVYAWMPLLAFELPPGHAQAGALVRTAPGPQGEHLNMGYHRLSPFVPEARQVIREIYEDLSRAAHFAGLLFHDDVTLSDYEDDSEAAHAVYREWGFPEPLAVLRGDDDKLKRWSAHKTAFLDGFAMELAGIVRCEVPDLRTARNLYAQVVLNPYSETWYSQSLASSLRHYDFTAIMAMPYMEQAPDHAAFYRDLVTRVAAEPGAMRKVVFELQATDWRSGRRLPSRELADTVTSLYDQGAVHIGYYPDNLFQDHPDTAVMREAFEQRAQRLRRLP